MAFLSQEDLDRELDAEAQTSPGQFDWGRRLPDIRT